MPGTKTRRRDHQAKCIGFTEALEQQREKDLSRTGPHSWLVRKLTVGIVVGIVGYTYYVYVARFCVPMFRRDMSSIGGRSMGIAFLVVFNLLFLMFGWAYVKVVVTSPGYARDYVSHSPPPVPPPRMEPHPGWDSEEFIAGTPYSATASPSRNPSRRSIEMPSFSNSSSRSPAHSRHNTRDTAASMSQTQPAPHRTDTSEAGTLDVIPPVGSSRAADNQTQVPISTPRPPPVAHMSRNDEGSDLGLPPPLYSRRPPTHPALLPEYRYCNRDGFIKPMRAHHCRSCGTCVLKYDHHCPWIGQCVGAFNHKFFVNFLFWSSIFTTFVFATLIALNARPSTLDASPDIDPQHIVIIVLSGIFTLFTFTLFSSHVHLILLNASTVEHLGMQRMHERERSVLSQMVPTCPCSSRAHYPPDTPLQLDASGRSPVRVLTSRRRIQKQWDAEWGKIGTEGNLWWLGSKRANWEAVMGRNKLGWILPIGWSPGDGLTYPTNPRFDRDGRWRRRAEWPAGLREHH